MLAFATLAVFCTSIYLAHASETPLVSFHNCPMPWVSRSFFEVDFYLYMSRAPWFISPSTSATPRAVCFLTWRTPPRLQSSPPIHPCCARGSNPPTRLVSCRYRQQYFASSSLHASHSMATPLFLAYEAFVALN
jgi:hypothetical protein